MESNKPAEAVAHNGHWLVRAVLAAGPGGRTLLRAAKLLTAAAAGLVAVILAAEATKALKGRHCCPRRSSLSATRGFNRSSDVRETTGLSLGTELDISFHGHVQADSDRTLHGRTLGGGLHVGGHGGLGRGRSLIGSGALDGHSSTACSIDVVEVTSERGGGDMVRIDGGGSSAGVIRSHGRSLALHVP